ncbi:hypothetical protein BGZ74_006636 [Mortierella antarctica]|nr:hypothetical protein BGZ74_006636 [Mortierella antarctica]
MIVGYLRGNLAALRTLLYVNRFFFKAALPVLLRTLLVRLLDHRRFNSIQDGLAALMISSVIHSQRTLWYSKTENSGTTFSATTFLAVFGLKLIEPITSPLLQDAFQGVSPTTVNYIQYPTKIFQYNYHIENFLSETFAPPLQRIFTASDFHGVDIQEGVLGHTARTRFLVLFMVCYPESIRDLSFHISEAHRYLPFAGKLSSLKAIELSRDEDEAIPKTHLNDAISFLQTNRTTFPKKEQLKLSFDESWDYWKQWDDTISAQEQRNLESEHQTSIFALYHALGDPVKLDATGYPGFYDIAKTFEVGALRVLTDFDGTRYDFGEGPDQQEFLKRCHQLQVLIIDVGYPELFSWAVERKSDGTVEEAPGNFLGSLRDIRLHADVSPVVLNDVTTGFGKSLLSIQTQIDLELSCFGGFYLGDFSACPQLEDMKLLILGRRLTLPDPTDTSVKHGYLSPVWKLPRLRNLQVYQEASVMFNFASLDHMPISNT